MLPVNPPAPLPVTGSHNGNPQPPTLSTQENKTLNLPFSGTQSPQPRGSSFFQEPTIFPSIWSQKTREGALDSPPPRCESPSTLSCGARPDCVSLGSVSHLCPSFCFLGSFSSSSPVSSCLVSACPPSSSRLSGLPASLPPCACPSTASF